MREGCGRFLWFVWTPDGGEFSVDENLVDGFFGRDEDQGFEGEVKDCAVKLGAVVRATIDDGGDVGDEGIFV